jgi:hypothetical protein
MQELPAMPPTPKKRGRPSTGTARSNAQRQSAFRLEKRIAVASCDICNFPVAPDSVLLARLKESIKSINSAGLSAEDIDTARYVFDKLIAELNKRYSNVI